MDDADRASVREEMDRDAALAAVKQNGQEKQLIIDEVICCRGCEEPIPSDRLHALPNACRCRECQERFERQRGR